MTFFSPSWHGLTLGILWGLGAGAMAQTQARALETKRPAVSYTCRVVYQPAQTLWLRELEIEGDRKGFHALRIDGVPVHGFSVDGARMTTHLDNERIEVNLQDLRWQSQFRTAAQGSGVCVKNR